MESLIKKHNSHLEEKGREIYRSNKHLQKIANLMENPEFRDFLKDYGNDWDDFQSMIMFMKIYEAIETQTNISFSPYEKLAILQKVISDKCMRREICEALRSWINKSTSLSNGKNRNDKHLRIDSK